jgi:hypothetical protein
MTSAATAFLNTLPNISKQIGNVMSSQRIGDLMLEVWLTHDWIVGILSLATMWKTYSLTK